MKHIQNIAVVTCLLLVTQACVKRDSKLCCAMPPAEMVRTQTQCADVWGYGATSDATITKLKNYLGTKQVTADKIELVATGEGMVCAACTCSNGFAFHVWVQSRYIDSLTKEGFVIK